MIRVYDQSWKELRPISGYLNPSHIQQIKNEIFLTLSDEIIKLSLDLEMIKFYSNNDMYSNNEYQGFYYDKKKDAIYVASFNSRSIDSFDRNLTLIKSMTTHGSPVSVCGGYKNYLFVGTQDGTILIFNNDSFIDGIQICEKNLNAIIVDKNGFLALLCNKKLTMHRINGKKLENEKVNFEFSENLNYIKKTSDDSLIFISDERIDTFKEI